MTGAPVLLFACGDVMTGRGVDQILPHPGDPRLREDYADDARAYVRLAEQASGPIPRPVSFAWPWGDALALLDAMAPDVRLINLETAVTRVADFAPGKAVHYRMSPRNVPCVAAARPDVCALANNHVLDFGRAGLAETLGVLDRAGLATAGAGRDAAAAWQPAAVPLPGGGRMLVFSCGTASSGIPPDWAAATGWPGVSFLPSLSGASADSLIALAEAVRQDGDLVAVSIHWGANWGYGVSPDEVRFAHRLVDGGISLVHGHSSHHPRPAEVYRGRLILYGCGDCIDDYEGISGHEEFRDELRLLYFASLTPGSGTLQALRMVPMRARNMRLRHAGPPDRKWLAATLNRISRQFGTQIEQQPDGTLLMSEPGSGASVVARNDAPGMRIDRYEFGVLVVDGREIRTDVLLTPGGVREHWWRREGHVLRLEDLGGLLDSHPERLIIGTGAFGRMRPDPGLGPELAARGVAVEVLPTAAAVDRINELLRLGRGNWAGALHLTC